jgi:hypothetical protein
VSNSANSETARVPARSATGGGRSATPRGGIDVARLRALEPARRIPGRNQAKADIVVYRYDGVDVALKDYSERPFLTRHLLGRWLIRRESRAYEAAGSVEGLAPFLGRVGPFALATEWRQAAPLSARPGQRLERDVFERAAAILDTLHGRRVALADLHHRDVLLADDGTVTIVDLAAAYVQKPGAGPLRRWWFTRLCELDRLALLRMEARFTGGSPEEAVAAHGGSIGRWHARGRRVKSWMNRLRGRR